MSNSKPLNLRKISELCGFSTCTVSRVLSGRAREFRITEATEQEILRVADAAGYRPNYLAHSLNTGRTHTIGLLFANRVDNYLGAILDGVEARLRGTPNRIVVATCENEPRILREEIDAFSYRQIEGIIVYPLARFAGEPNGSAKIRTPGLPTVIIGRKVAWDADEVMLNDKQAGRTAARRAVAAGARTFIIVTNPSDCSSDKNRVESFRAELLKLGVAARHVAVHDDIVELGKQAKNMARADAFFATNSGLLLNLVATLSAHPGFRPKYLGSVGEVEGHKLLKHPIDAIPIPGHELGFQAADLMLWRLDHPGEAKRQRRLVDYALN